MARAQREGRFKREMFLVAGKRKNKAADGTETWTDAMIDFDEGIQPGTTPLALQRAGISMRDIDLTEINEAFASVVLAWKPEMNADMSKVNVNGGATALGQPTGRTGRGCSGRS